MLVIYLNGESNADQVTQSSFVYRTDQHSRALWVIWLRQLLLSEYDFDGIGNHVIGKCHVVKSLDVLIDKMIKMSVPRHWSWEQV